MWHAIYSLNSMCCAQTAAPEGEKMVVGESMHGFSAAMNALCRSSVSFQGGQEEKHMQEGFLRFL